MLTSIVFFASIAVFVISMLYFINRATYYKNDERGLSIIAKSAMITFSSLLALFALFLCVITFIDVFDIPSSQLYSLIFIRNAVSIVVAVISAINSLSIHLLSRD
ncbi:hypothetical protein [Enterococcus gallinarum]|uniref:hypothetical protein n=1 Tax=Enterococcus gallinarum TaxID=1353 RepID=UPI0024972C03|nr:hypothetical protein [Enterococcus gallinarum]GMG59854.1 hypothetical protein AH4_32110 [Enterococcus gallinarum]